MHNRLKPVGFASVLRCCFLLGLGLVFRGQGRVCSWCCGLLGALRLAGRQSGRLENKTIAFFEHDVCETWTQETP